MNWNIIKRSIALVLFLLTGLGYAFFIMHTGHGIPCFFHFVTGLYCPGCGVTGMCLSLLEGNFARAFHQNSMLVLLLPFGVIYLIRYIKAFIRNQPMLLHKIDRWILRIVLLFLLLFGVLRNIPLFYFLRPYG